MGTLEFLCNRRFHRCFFLPPNPDAGRPERYRVSYADYGDSDTDAVVLVCGALMGGRLSYIPLDHLAKKYNVRIIHMDRSGVGGTQAVPVEQRISTWLEMVPALLSHLNISHVALASHSGGDVYLLNTLLNYPHILHPSTPYICFFAPWVHPDHSKVMHMQATVLLPAPMIGKFANLAKFVNDNVMPLTGLSGSLLNGIKGSMLSAPPAPAPVALAPDDDRPQSSPDHSEFNTETPDLDDPVVVNELRDHIRKFMFAETLDGVSADAQLFMRKPRSLQWCSSNMSWADIDDAVSVFSNMLEEDVAQQMSRNWTVDAFHASTDDMVGDRGRHWFDACWESDKKSSPNENDTTAQRPLLYRYESNIVDKSDHNYLMDPAFGASEKWLERVKKSFAGSEQA